MVKLDCVTNPFLYIWSRFSHVQNNWSWSCSGFESRDQLYSKRVSFRSKVISLLLCGMSSLCMRKWKFLVQTAGTFYFTCTNTARYIFLKFCDLLYILFLAIYYPLDRLAYRIQLILTSSYHSFRIFISKTSPISRANMLVDPFPIFDYNNKTFCSTYIFSELNVVDHTFWYL